MQLQCADRAQLILIARSTIMKQRGTRKLKRIANFRDVVDNFDDFRYGRRRAAREVTSGREICDCEYQAVKCAAGKLDYWTRCLETVERERQRGPSRLVRQGFAFRGNAVEKPADSAVLSTWSPLVVAQQRELRGRPIAKDSRRLVCGLVCGFVRIGVWICADWCVDWRGLVCGLMWIGVCINVWHCVGIGVWNGVWVSVWIGVWVGVWIGVDKRVDWCVAGCGLNFWGFVWPKIIVMTSRSKVKVTDIQHGGRVTSQHGNRSVPAPTPDPMMSPLKEGPWDMCVTERGNEEIQSSMATKYLEQVLEVAAIDLVPRLMTRSAGTPTQYARSLHVQLPPDLIWSHTELEYCLTGRSNILPLSADEFLKYLGRSRGAGEDMASQLVNYQQVLWSRGVRYSVRAPPKTFPSHQGEPGSIPGRVTPGFSHVRIVPDDAAGRWVFSGISRSHRPSIPALLHTRLT
ncbi:hypothetical protein PR048_032675 [Dryococelus australis]|uniref:Uncharacterized protein n=1 Tax=Dryococelus australis TaxID=614101 RepID=A0ABQ9G2V7_9NEOP|nr:hypothetical protein PR048_032675 [Dryococelus australis]